MPFINKSKIDRIIRKKSDRGVLSGKVVPYFEKIIKKIVIATIEADNESLTPKSKETLKTKHIKNALKNIDRQYGLEDLLMLELEGETYEIDLEKKSGDTININVNFNEDSKNDE